MVRAPVAGQAAKTSIRKIWLSTALQRRTQISKNVIGLMHGELLVAMLLGADMRANYRPFMIITQSY